MKPCSAFETVTVASFRTSAATTRWRTKPPRGVAAGQEPFAIILGCSDSRVPAEIVFDQGLGDLFVIRVAGNIVAPSQVGSVEFAAERYGTRLVVVLGHSQCGAILATIDELKRPTVQPVPESALDRRSHAALPSSRCCAPSCASDPERSCATPCAPTCASPPSHLRHGSGILEQLIDKHGLVVVGAEYSLETGLSSTSSTACPRIREYRQPIIGGPYAQRRPGGSGCGLSASLAAQNTPEFQIDPFRRSRFPTNGLSAVLAASARRHDHIVVTNRRDITEEEAETSLQSPSVLIFDLAGNLVHSFADSNAVPSVIHGCFVDHENNIWITANGDGMIQKYTHDGKLLLQIGTKGVYDTSDGTRQGHAAQCRAHAFIKPAGISRRDERQRLCGGRIRQPACRGVRFQRQLPAPVGSAGDAGRNRDGRRRRLRRSRALHHDEQRRPGVRLRSTGRPRASLRQGGQLPEEHLDQNRHATLPDRRGTAWWAEFSRDPEQKFLYVMNGRNEQVHILDHASGEILSSFGRPGHQLGNFTHGHSPRRRLARLSLRRRDELRDGAFRSSALMQ